LNADLLASANEYLTENLAVDVLYAEGKAVELELPSSVTLKVVESPEGLRGDSANNVQKAAKLETGKMIQVPLFIKEGELIRVDTRTGAYMGRA
jgi:elongation factor P